MIAGFVLAPFMVIGAWARRRSLDFGPFFLYAVLLFTFSALVSAVHVPGGTFIHSAVALAPHAYILALEGIAIAVGWVAARRRTWDPMAATRVFIGATLAFAAVVAFFGSPFVHQVWADSRAKFVAVAGALDRAGAAGDGPGHVDRRRGHRYWTGRGGVVLVNDPIETVGSGCAARTTSAGSSSTVRTAWRPPPPSSTTSAGRTGSAIRSCFADEPSPLVRVCPVVPGTMTRREAVLTAAARSSSWRSSCGRISRRRSSSPSPRTPPTTSASRATCSRAAASCRDALWSYQTPPLVFPRPAFEVWLPLPTFLAAIPMALLGPTFAAAQVSSVVIGALVPVLAWRLAADVAEERGLPVGSGRRTLAIGTGLTTAVYLPLLLHSAAARLDDAVRGARARRLPADDPDRARPARRVGSPIRGSSASACSSASPR